MLQQYQDRLRLNDWDIDWEFCSQDELGQSIGRCLFNPAHMCATVKLLDPKYNSNSEDIYEGIEVTIAHELIHILVNPLFRENVGSVEHDAQEAAVEKIARAIVNV